MPAQAVLDLPGGDLEAAALDHVYGLPPHDRDAAVRVAPRDVAGQEPAVPERSGGIARTAPVGRHQAVALDDDLSQLPGLHLGASVVRDADLASGDGEAHGARPA